MTTFLRLGLLAKTPWNRASRFVFLEPGKLQDQELELIAPAAQWTDALMASVDHPSTLQNSPTLANLTRRQVNDFLSTCPLGHQSGGRAVFPSYHFWMLDHARPDLPMAGAICLRVGAGPELELYYGHVGYHVYPPHRGRNFAERAVRLLLPLARNHRVNPIWITCNPENFASRRTCENLGATLVQTVPLPVNHPLSRNGETSKCSFRLDVPC